MEFELDEGAKLALDKKPGEERERCEVAATSATTALKGLCALVEETAARLGMTAEEIVCRMAVILFHHPEC